MHKGSCSFPNHQPYTDPGSGEQYVLERRRNHSGYHGVYTNQPKGKVSDARSTSSAKIWCAHHTAGCKHLGCMKEGYLGGACTREGAALLLAKHMAEFVRCHTCESGNEPLGNQIIICSGKVDDGHDCGRSYHMQCLQPPLECGIPEGDWLCSRCDGPPPEQLDVDMAERGCKKKFTQQEDDKLLMMHNQGIGTAESKMSPDSMASCACPSPPASQFAMARCRSRPSAATTMLFRLQPEAPFVGQA